MGYLMAIEGGPYPGTRVHPGPWPLPDTFEYPTFQGRYVKVSESALPPEVDDIEGLMRGAKYLWEPEGTCLHRVGHRVDSVDPSKGTKCQDCGEVLPVDGYPLTTASGGV